ncbi:MAG: protein translocase subunit SecF [bacterium]|nr:protein translocase subunit SecF [bacterium]
MELISPGTKIDFVGQSRAFSIVSVAVVVAALVLMLVAGFNLGIDFKGGTVVQVHVAEAAGAIDEGQVRASVSEVGFPDAVITRFGSVEDRSFRISLPISHEEDRDLAINLAGQLTELLGGEVSAPSVESIGPRVGEELRQAGVGAMLLSWALILIYIWFRFDLRYAPGAVVALVHDVIITAGVFVLFGWEFNLQVVAALLVVIGYSLNDTIVIYDRIRENLGMRGATHLDDVVNQSINQTLSRTLLTSLTTLFVIVAILSLGGPVLRDFALALLIGIVVGTYSTVYVASAMLIFLERRYPPQTAAA